MTKAREIAIITFSAALGFLLFLELSLWVISFLHHKTAVTEAYSTSPGAYVILCLGGSYTYGMGAAPEQSYPRQLETLLNSHGKGRSFKVVNKGYPGQNSSQLLREFDANLKIFKPSMVIVMTGLNNCWNYIGYDEFLKKNSLWTKVHELLYRIKSYKLACLLLADIKAKGTVASGPEIMPGKTPPQNPALAPQLPNHRSTSECAELNRYVTAHDYGKALAWLKTACSHDPNNPYWYQESARILTILSRYPEALRAINQALKLQPDNSEYYAYKGSIYREMQDFDRAILWLNKALEINPENPSPYPILAGIYNLRHDEIPALEMYRKYILAYPEDTYRTAGAILEIFKNLNDPEGALKFFKTLGKHNPQCATVARLLQNTRSVNQGIATWIEHDLDTLAVICARKHIRLVLMSYPIDIFSQNLTALQNDLFKKIAIRLHVAFIDNYAIFKSLQDSRKEYFVPDGHCNARGYGLIARNIVNVILPGLEPGD